MKSLALVVLLFAFSPNVSRALDSAQTPQDYVISGQVMDESGVPVVDVRMCAYPDDYEAVRQQSCSRSRANGQFAIPTGRPAAYTIYAENFDAGYAAERPFYRHPGSLVPRIVLSEAKRTASLTFRLPPKNGQLMGKAVDAITGRPIDNLRFLMCQVSNRRACWSTSAKNAQGEFKLLAAHVPFTLQLFAEGYETWFGTNGGDINESIYVPSDARIQVFFRLQRLTALADSALSEPEKQAGVNLPAPVQTAPDDGVELNYFPRKTKLEWQPVAGAILYRVEIDYCDGLVHGRKKCLDPQPHHRERNDRDIRETSFDFNFVGAQPGRWRVWAIDEKGQEGFKSPWRIFFYLQ
ncbi:MAG: eukaryotic-like serine/threonine-protein kinase [Pyrinomonadaceae bacterium]|jgi:hypothetical protein|nr:eukaryotic-like serine/threonine-protein kinase [Pyrinomonadaceae bacterium]